MTISEIFEELNKDTPWLLYSEREELAARLTCEIAADGLNFNTRTVVGILARHRLLDSPAVREYLKDGRQKVRDYHELMLGIGEDAE